MANIEVTINAITMRDFKRQLQEWCEELQIMPAVDPNVVLETVDLDSLRQHLEQRLKDQGFTIDIKAMVDEVVEVKIPKRVRKEKTEARLKELVLEVDENDPKLEAVKSQVILQLQELYMNGGKERVDGLIKKYGNGATKLIQIPADRFPQIAEELEDESD